MDINKIIELQGLVVQHNKYYEVGPKLIKINLGAEEFKIEVETEKTIRYFELTELDECIKFTKEYIEQDKEYEGYKNSYYDDREECGGYETI